jgi:hypothetical protein
MASRSRVFGTPSLGVFTLVVVLGLIPPEELHVRAPGYVAGMVAAVGGVIALPFVIRMFRRPGWLTTPTAVEGEQA